MKGLAAILALLLAFAPALADEGPDPVGPADIKKALKGCWDRQDWTERTRRRSSQPGLVWEQAVCFDGDRRALIDDLWDRIESELDAAPVTEEVGRLLDERAALARDPKRKKFTLEQIAA